MARASTAARRYAEAVFDIATRDKKRDRWAADLALAAEILADERVARIVNSPATPLRARATVLEDLLSSRITGPALNLVRLLDTRGRLTLLPAISAQYTRLVDRAQGVVPATVTSAAALDRGEVAAVRSRVEAMTAQTVKLTTAVDPALIGGLTVQIGDRLIDASVRGRLERLRDQLVAGTR